MAQKEEIVDKYCVYTHTAPDCRIYVGLTKNLPSNRWQRGAGYKGNSYFTRAINKYGWDNFTHTIVADNLTEDEAKNLEILLISLHHSNERQYGFNISSGGESKKGTKISDWHKEQISKASKGKIVSESTRKKLSEATKRVWQNEEHVQKMRELNLGPNNPQYGKKHNDEERLKRGAKSILQFDLQGNLVREFISRNEASRQTGINRYAINKLCNEQGIGYGYMWKWK